MHDTLRHLQYLIQHLTDRLWPVLAYPVEIGPVTLPVWLLATQALLLAGLGYFLSGGRRRSWRVAASRRWLKRFRANAHRYSETQRFAYIRKIDHFLFEDVLMSAFEERGYSVIRTPATGDGGSDGYVNLDGLRVVVQAKRYNGPIARVHVMALERLARTKRGQDAGLFIHTGRTSKPIKQYIAASDTLDLISGMTDLIRFLDGYPLHVLGRAVRPLKKHRTRHTHSTTAKQTARSTP